MANTARLVIDPITRKISTKYEKIRLAKNDNNSMMITFEMPRYVRGHDMSNCSTIEVHYDNISIDRKQKRSDVYVVTDIIVAPEDDETINFSWLVSRGATQIVGNVDFSLHFGCSEDPDLEYAWHTTTYSGIVVLESKHNTQSVVEKHPDLVASILDYVDKKISEFDAVDIAQETGESTEAVMSQKATTDALGTLAQSLLGNEVAKAIEKLCAPEKTNERLSRLEAAAEGILFSYPIEDSACEVLRAPAHVMSYGALCRLGGAPIPQKNLLPEKILSTYRGENLTVTWDSAEGCLIFNGTVTAAEAPVVLAPFNSPATYGYYHAAIFPRSGSKIKPTGSGNVYLRFYAEDEKYISLDLSKDIPVTTGSLLRTGGKKFSRIVIATNTTMQFDNYKINILLQAGTCDEPVYVPFESLITPSPIPSKITACSPNEWEGEFSKEGLGGVTFLPQKIFSSGQYAISFFATVEGAATTCHFHTYLENGRIIKRGVPTDERAQVLLEFDAPVTMFKIFPMATEEESVPYAIRVKDFQVEHESPIYEYAYDFSTPYSHTLSLPESFSRYADRFIGMGNEICNHFDFERGMFVTTVKCYRMDDTLSFSADTEIASRFHAAVTLPEDLIASTNYMSSSLFHPLIDETACDECIWFTEDGITIQSSLFKTAEDIPAFLRIHPIDILYEVPAEKEFLTPEEADFFSPPLLPVVPDASITLYDSSNTPVVGFIRMQYETQNLLEEEIV